MQEQRKNFQPELIAMIAVIAISSWHVGNYMSSIDGWLMATIMGAVLGYCNFIMAHNIFKSESSSRFPSFIGLIFFAFTSTWLQYAYFNRAPEMTSTYLMGINIDALFMGSWAPAAEVLLGWVHAANTPMTTDVPSILSSAHEFQLVTNPGLTQPSPVAEVATEQEREHHHEQASGTLSTLERSRNGAAKPQSDRSEKSTAPKVKLDKTARHLLIRDHLRTVQDDMAIPVQEWADEFGVSRQTIYRDLNELKQNVQPSV